MINLNGVIVYENDKLKDLNIIIPNSGFTSRVDVTLIKFDENVNIDVTINKHKLKNYIEREIINNPNVVENY